MNVPAVLLASSIPALATAGALARRAGYLRPASDGAQALPPVQGDDLEHQRNQIKLPTTPLRAFYRRLRYAVDRILAAVLLVALSPVFGAITIAVRLDSHGPALFRQRRIGVNGNHFTIVKFRTLRVEAPEFSVKVGAHDSTITRVGRFLRRSGLDELPQLWNVLRGEMAIIGPRPEQAALIDLYEPWQRQREAIRPGITGWWQIHHRDDLPLHLNVDKDLYYIRHQSPWIDLLILIGTFRILLGALSCAIRLRSPREESATANRAGTEG